jgi:hypothetical protein
VDLHRNIVLEEPVVMVDVFPAHPELFSDLTAFAMPHVETAVSTARPVRVA